MPSLNFQSRFAEAVESGRKLHSIRAKLRFKVGDMVHLFTGMRTKQCRRIGRGVVTAVQPVSIRWAVSSIAGGSVPSIAVGIKLLKIIEAERLARDDGFSSAAEMLAWFEETHGLPFAGWLIRWELLKP